MLVDDEVCDLIEPGKRDAGERDGRKSEPCL